jgi:aldehyde:ferredoxin oxidoreductase
VLSLDAQSPKSKAEMCVFMQDCLESVSSAGGCLFSAQTFIPAVFFKLGPTHWVTRMAGKIATHAGGVVKLMLKMTNLICFNSLYLLPHAEAIRLTTGFRMYTGQFINLGERSFNLERLYNLREGITSKDDTLPDRLINTPQVKGRLDTVVPLNVMLPKYYAVRGWNASGVPTPKKLRRLGIV